MINIGLSLDLSFFFQILKKNLFRVGVPCEEPAAVRLLRGFLQHGRHRDLLQEGHRRLRRLFGAAAGRLRLPTGREIYML